MRLIEYFSSFFRIYDSYKNEDGKGLFERYTDVIDTDINNSISAVNGLIQRFSDVTIQDTFVSELVAEKNGLAIPDLYAGNSLSVKRRLALFAKECVENRGRIAGVAYHTYLIFGNTTQVSVTEDSRYYRFDSTTTLDSDERVLDSVHSRGLLKFIFNIQGVPPAKYEETIAKIVNYNTPFDCNFVVKIFLNNVFSNEFSDEFE